MTNRIVVGISGASGVQYGVRLLEVLRELEIESHLVISKMAELTLSYELDMTAKEVKNLASYVHFPERHGCEYRIRVVSDPGNGRGPVLGAINRRHRERWGNNTPREGRRCDVERTEAACAPAARVTAQPDSHQKYGDRDTRRRNGVPPGASVL